MQFTRGEVAKILGIVPRTIARREERGEYPEPRRDISNRRIYNIKEVMRLQHLTYGEVNTRNLFEALYDKDVRNHNKASKMIEEALQEFLRDKTIANARSKG